MKSKFPFLFGSGFAAARHCRPARSHRVRLVFPPRSSVLAVCAVFALAPLAPAATITWIGGNADWVNNGDVNLWNPKDEPDSDDDVVFNTANTVTLGSANYIRSLALSNGISLNTNNFGMNIYGLLQLTGAGTDLTISGSDSTVWTDGGTTLNSSSRVYLADGVLAVTGGIIDNNAGCIVSGRGVIALNANVAVATTLFDNDGMLSADSTYVLPGIPVAGSLVIAAVNSFARIDLDGTSGNGVVNVESNQLLDVNVALADTFSGDLNLYHASTINVSTAWGINDGSTVDVDNGRIDMAFPYPDIPANTSSISGAAFTQSGGTITVVDTDGTLQFNAPFTQSGGNLVNNGKVVFNANATIGAGANFTMPTGNSSLTVNTGATVTVNQEDFNADGSGLSSNSIVLNGSSALNLNLGAGADESLTGTMIVGGATLTVNTLSDTWSLTGTLAIQGDTGTSRINGEAVMLSGTTNIATNSVLRVNAASTLPAGASITVASGARLELANNILNGITSVTGAGTLQVLAPTTVAANSTIAVDTFDWDGTASDTNHTINAGVTLTINSPNIDTDGNINDNITLGGNGSTLAVNGPAEWTMNGELNSNPAAAGTATVRGTSRVIFGGAINANSGTTWIDSTATVADTSLATVAGGAVLHFDNPVTLQGGAANGAGTLRIGSTSEVSGNNAVSVHTVDWDGTASGSSHTIIDGATLAISCTNFDSDGDMDDPMTIRGNGATLSVSGPVSWEMLGTLNIGAGGRAYLSGTSRLVAGGIFNVNGNTTANASITFGPSSVTAVAGWATLDLNAVPTFSGGEIVGGGGRLRIGGAPTVTANTTISVGSLDWDRDNHTHTHTINQGVNLTITSAIIEGGGMRDGLRILGNGGTLTVSGPALWEMRNTLTTNPAAVGITTLAGTSRLVLTSASGLFNANGDTTVSAPITFGTGSTTTVVAELVVNGDAIYQGGTISGAGSYRPPAGSHNTVTANSIISVTDLNFDFGDWTVEPGVQLTLNVGDYDSDTATNAFDGTLTLNGGTANVSTADAVFVMDGRLNLSNASGSLGAWTGEAIQIGNDTGSLDADLMVDGTDYSGIYSAVVFKSDADVSIAPGATLMLAKAVTFQSVNGAENARFTGNGTLITSAEVHYDEATTLNLVGGRIDLDGADATGDTHYVMAPLTINTATLDGFGATNTSGTNIIDVNGWTGSGSLTVNLDRRFAEWTLKGPGLLRLINDPTSAAPLTLLAGSDANLNGTVNVIGDVRTAARVDIGGTVEIQTAGKPFRLSGGDLTDTNTLVGGTINGPGILGADSGSSLFGYGTINANIGFDGSSDLLADNGTLTVNGSIVVARYVGTNDTGGILDVVNPWNSNKVSGVRLKGGEVKGGLLTNSGAGGVSGFGLVSSKVVNNSIINANESGATLIVETDANNNDWDGSSETGQLQANAGTLEIRSIIMGGVFPFNGTVTASNGGTVFASGFALGMESGSALNLTNGTFKQSDGMLTGLSGPVTVGAGTSSLLGAATGGFRFNSGSATALSGDLHLDCPTTTIRALATFTGAGRLVNQFGRRLSPDNGAIADVLVENRGTLSPGDTGVAQNTVKNYVQTATGNLALDLRGKILGNFDWLLVDGGAAQLAGSLTLTLGGGYVPVLNDTITILSATGSVTGTFSSVVQPAGMPAGLAFEPVYASNNVQIKVVSSSPFDAWIDTFGIANPADRTKGANPDGDSLNNLGEFATDGDPTSGTASGKIVGKNAPVGGVNAFTLTLPVRYGTVADPADPAGAELGLTQTADGLFYKIQASDELGAWTLTVTEVADPDTATIQFGLPALNPGWTYRTFRSPGPVTGDPLEFMRVKISD